MLERNDQYVRHNLKSAGDRGDSSNEVSSQPIPRPRLQNGKAHARQQKAVQNGGLQNGLPTFDVLGSAVDSRCINTCLLDSLPGAKVIT